MNKAASTIITTACIGMAVGTAAYMMNGGNSSMSKKTRRLKRNTGRALRQVGEFINGVSYMVK